MSEDRQQKILESSMELFLHYGFRRTTMGDIARAAGISRPTLYGMYASKEAVFAGVIETYVSQLDAQLRACFEPDDTLADKLQKALRIAVVEPFSMFHGSNFKHELMSIDDDSVKEQIERLMKGLEQVYTRCFEGHRETLKRFNRTPAQLGRTLHCACLGIKERAADLEDLQSMLDVLVHGLASENPHECSKQVGIGG